MIRWLMVLFNVFPERTNVLTDELFLLVPCAQSLVAVVIFIAEPRDPIVALFSVDLCQEISDDGLVGIDKVEQVDLLLVELVNYAILLL